MAAGVSQERKPCFRGTYSQRSLCRFAALPRWSANGSKASPMATPTYRGAASPKARTGHGTRLWAIRGLFLAHGGSESALKPLGHELAFHWSAVQGQPRRLLAMRTGLPQPVGRSADVIFGGVQRSAGLSMAPLHKHNFNAMSNESTNNVSPEQGGAIDKPAVLGSATPLLVWRDEDDDDDDRDDEEPSGYICMCCGHSDEHSSMLMGCPMCCGPMEPMWF